MKLYLGVFPGHDSNVSLFDEEGQVIFAINNGRLTRDKDSFAFPAESLEYISDKYGNDIEALIAIRMDRFAKVMRDFQFIVNAKIKGLGAVNIPHILKHYFTRVKGGRILEAGFKKESHINLKAKKTFSIPHHHAHAGSAYYSSGFQDAWVLSLDGQGDDGYSTTFFKGKGSSLELYKGYYFNELPIGRNYMLTTSLVGLHGGRHPGKLTGLAGHNAVNEEALESLRSFWNQVWKTKYKGDYLNYNDYLIYDPEGKKEMKRIREERFGKFSIKELAWAIQTLTEETVFEIIRKNIPVIKGSRIALAGGVVTNVKLNQKIKEMGFSEIFIQPAMGDEGLSFGGVQYHLGKELNIKPRKLDNVYLGPEYTNDKILELLKKENVDFVEMKDPPGIISDIVAEGFVIARFNGRMEYGPRALGNRTIFFRSDDPSANDWLNKRLNRTEYMPFAPITLHEKAYDCYEDIKGAEYAAKFMTITFKCTDFMKKVSPGVVHVDETARPQLIEETDNPPVYNIIKEFYKKTGTPSLVNTSFNMHEEPIVCTPEDALRSFHMGHLDYLAIGDFLVKNKDIDKKGPSD
ncbi:MAG: hypothetical protein JXA60_10530 [Candidatus Coatesbacteria bacterium]|nr:hypothetical protein [Candidatus Coatesbacteria bacterium]